MKHIIRRILQSIGLDILKTPTLYDFIKSRDTDLVVDVGGNIGQFGKNIRGLGYKGRIVSFEPVSSAYVALQHCATADGKWEAVKKALGSESGTAEINVSEDTVYSSILSQTSMARSFDGRTRINKVETVEITRLDDAIRDEKASKIFLKIDTQGFEKQVLAGASSTLKKCIGIQLELPVDHLYQGVWSFSEAIIFIRELGFEPAQIRPLSTSPADRASAVEFDCIFKRCAS